MDAKLTRTLIAGLVAVAALPAMLATAGAADDDGTEQRSEVSVENESSSSENTGGNVEMGTGDGSGEATLETLDAPTSRLESEPAVPEGQPAERAVREPREERGSERVRELCPGLFDRSWIDDLPELARDPRALLAALCPGLVDEAAFDPQPEVRSSARGEGERHAPHAPRPDAPAAASGASQVPEVERPEVPDGEQLAQEIRDRVDSHLADHGVEPRERRTR